MPFQSTMTADEKAKVKNVLSANNKILMATVARIYYAHPDPNAWTFSGRQGGLAFVKDKNNGLYYFRVVDLQGTTGVLWEHELYEGFTLNEDRPFFHSFAGDDCMVGLVYSDESEAASFMKIVTKKRGMFGKAKVESSSRKKSTKSAKSGKVTKDMISAPKAGSFKHVSHMGYDHEKGFISENIDPSWLAFLQQLEHHGVDPDVIMNNMDFIKGFVRDAQAQQQSRNNKTTGSKAIEAPKKKPSEKPPLPPAPAARKKSQKAEKPPVPPSLRRGHGQQDSVSSLQTPAESPKPSTAPPAPPAPPPPAPPAPAPPTPPSAAPPAPPTPTPPSRPPPAPSRAPPSAAPPPPPPTRPPVPTPAANGAAAPPPPAPPPPPAAPSGGAPPPPPPPPPAPVGAPPPPPPPPPGGAPPSVKASLPPAQDGRSALLQSIQGKSVHSLRKTEGPRESQPIAAGRVVGEPSTPSVGDHTGGAATATEESSSGAASGGGDLAAALAAALTQRNKKLGESDDEDDEEEWD